jgi:hypothetical protein
VQEGPLPAHDPGDEAAERRGQDDHRRQQDERLDQVRDEHLEALRSDEGVDEVADQGDGDHQGEQVLPVHGALPSGPLDEGEPDEAQRGQREHHRGDDEVHRASGNDVCAGRVPR